jgi:hypothetical protein
MGCGGIGQHIEEGARVVDEPDAEVGEAMLFRPAIGEVFQENRHVIVGIRMRVAARDLNRTTRSIRSPYISTSAARKRDRTGSLVDAAAISPVSIDDDSIMTPKA